MTSKEYKALKGEAFWATACTDYAIQKYKGKHGLESTIALMDELTKYVYAEMEKPSKKIKTAKDVWEKRKSYNMKIELDKFEEKC